MNTGRRQQRKGWQHGLNRVRAPNMVSPARSADHERKGSQERPWWGPAVACDLGLKRLAPSHRSRLYGGRTTARRPKRTAKRQAGGNPKSIVLYDKECIDKMRVVQSARRVSRGERAARRLVKGGIALRSVLRRGRALRPSSRAVVVQFRPSKPTRDQRSVSVQTSAR